jgi:hypothetical protein
MMKVLKAGEYYIGDCCYVLDDNLENFDWVDDFCEPFWSDEENIVVKGHQIVAYGTAHGDGEYPSNIGATFPVDAGLIGVVPKELWQGGGEPFGCTLVKFEKDFVCDKFAGTLQFGNVLIYTDYAGEYEGEE